MAKSEKASLYSCDYIFGHLPDIDTKAIEKMVLENHKKKSIGKYNGPFFLTFSERTLK